MQLSQNQLNKTIESQLEKMLLGILTETDDAQRMKSILSELFTETERIAVLKRLGIAIYLDKKRSYEDIKNNIKVSSATIASVSEQQGNQGWQEIVKMIKAEEWSSEWSERISKRVKRIFG